MSPKKKINTASYNLLETFVVDMTVDETARLLDASEKDVSQISSKILEEDDTQKRVDKGLLYLSLAMFVWVLSGCWSYTGNLFSFEKTISFGLAYTQLLSHKVENILGDNSGKS